MKALYCLLAFLLGLGTMPKPFAQTPVPEICDNALDDDADGLIDLNDADCDCPSAEPLSLIPNPSFEDTVCCPGNRSQLYCANGWIQASEPTTDLLHTCGWMGWDDLPPPLPFPDGEACVGFRNGRPGFNTDAPNGNWKEYAGACLTNPLKAGVTYRFEFYIGFTYALHSPTTNLWFFGTPDCQNLPFGSGDEAFGCPTNGPGWVPLGDVVIGGTYEWKKTEITVTPDQDMHAIAIGPECELGVEHIQTYYFFDNLVLAAQSDFDFRIHAMGNPCTGELHLDIAQRDTLLYQWYKDGVALLGQNSAQLSGVQDGGKYQVSMLGPNSCRISEPYSNKIPVFYSSLEGRICNEDSYLFHGKPLSESGTYFDTLQTAAGCDSIVRLTLEVMGAMADTIHAKVFESESWPLGGTSYHEPGEYDARLTSSLGCDSLVHLILGKYKLYAPNVFSPNDDGINDVFTLYSGEDIQEILQLRVFDRWGDMMFENGQVQPGKLASGWDGRRKGELATPGVYAWKAVLLFDDGKAREVTGEIELLR